MRRTNWWLVIVGAVLALLALAFFVYMGSIASQSTDPAGLMSTVGTVSGVVGGIAAVMVVFGFIGKKS